MEARARFVALPDDTDSIERETLVGELADGREILSTAESDVLKAVVTRKQVRAALSLSNKETRIIDKSGGPLARFPAPR